MKRVGIYRYCEDTLFRTYPEIRGTIFFPLALHPFLRHVQERFELAFHGISHGRYLRPKEPGLLNNWEQEFEYLRLEDVPQMRDEIQRFTYMCDIRMTGGKYPGYQGSPCAEAIVEALWFRWWMRDADMIGRRTIRNTCRYFGKERKILDIPTNMGSGFFKHSLDSRCLFNGKQWLKKKFPCLAAAMGRVATAARKSSFYHTYLGINLVFKPLDRFARLSCFHGQFETNALGYCYVFKKVAGTSKSP